MREVKVSVCPRTRLVRVRGHVVRAERHLRHRGRGGAGAAVGVLGDGGGQLREAEAAAPLLRDK